MKRTGILIFPLLLLAISSCKKGETEVAGSLSGVNFSVKYTVDGVLPEPDQLTYQAPAGYLYSINKLCYYLSDIRLIRSDSSFIPLFDVYYGEMGDAERKQTAPHEIAAGRYIGIAFFIGLQAHQNISFGLPASTENINMQWPEHMGGGYHFMKLEGHFKDSTGIHGYAMHIGNVPASELQVYCDISIPTAPASLILEMNIAEWFRHPYDYDFNKDGNYIMGNGPVMKKFFENGKDVFSLQP